MRLVILITIVLITEIYAFQVVKTLSKNPITLVIYALISLGVIFYVGYTFANYDRSIGPTQKTLTATAIMLLSIAPKLVLILFMFGEDIVRLGAFGYNYVSNILFNKTSHDHFPERRRFVSQIALGVAAIPFVGLIHGIFKGKYNFKVLTHTLYYSDLPDAFDGLRLTQISDIHSGSFDNKEKIEYAIDLINQQESDLLLFTGDIVNTVAAEMDDWIPVFKQIRPHTFGKFSVLGNHDYGEYVTWDSQAAKDANFEAIKEVHSKIDFDLLLNSNRFLEKEGQRLAIMGVENWGHNFKKAGDLAKAGQGVRDTDFKILLSHDPSHWEYEVKDAPDKYHLTLSGHTHGFQFGIEVPGFIKWSPVQYVYKYWAGMYQQAEQYLHVNRGFGFHAYPGRVGIWPEITVIELRKKPVA